MPTNNKNTPSTNDNRYLNYVALTTMITRAIQRRNGTHQLDFDLAADIAWDISRQISSDVVIEKAKSLTVQEILQNHQVQQSNLTKTAQLLPAQKSSTRNPHNGAMWGVAGGLLILILLLIVVG